jgi:hypothetical protein
MLSRADKYREKAEECRQEAGKATDHDTKADWLKLANKWQRMAQEAYPGPQLAEQPAAKEKPEDSN